MASSASSSASSASPASPISEREQTVPPVPSAVSTQTNAVPVASQPPDDAAAFGWRRLRAWWHEPHFLEKNTIFGCALLVAQLIIKPPASPSQMMFALGWIAIVVGLPFAPRSLCVFGTVASIAVTMLPLHGWPATGGTAIGTVFLATGYVMPRWAAILMPVAYCVLDSIGFVTLRSGSMFGELIAGLVGEFSQMATGGGVNEVWDTAMDATLVAGTKRSVMMPQYTLIVFIATLLLTFMICGFLTMFGAAFRRTSEANARAARSEWMLGRMAREQELAHVIHDSVANDMSTIAMLAWRAQHAGADGNDGAMLDAIYDRAHHALDRVHEVIDVLNGRLDLSQVEVDGGRIEAGGTFDVQVERYAEDQDRIMGMLGIHGVTRINSIDAPNVSDAARRVAMRLLEEIYANIVRHCAMDGGGAQASGEGAPAARALGDMDEPPAYTLFIDVNERRIRISEVNAITDESRTLARGHRHGNGIGLHRAVVESLGGTLNTSAQDGTWILNAEIPV